MSAISTPRELENSTKRVVVQDMNTTHDNHRILSDIGLVYLAVFASVLLITVTLFIIIFVVWKFGMSHQKVLDRRLFASRRRVQHQEFKYRAPDNYTSKVHQFSEVLSKIDFSKRPSRRSPVDTQLSSSPQESELCISNTLQKKLLSDLKDFQYDKDHSK